MGQQCFKLHDLFIYRTTIRPSPDRPIYSDRKTDLSRIINSGLTELIWTLRNSFASYYYVTIPWEFLQTEQFSGHTNFSLIKSPSLTDTAPRLIYLPWPGHHGQDRPRPSEFVEA